MLVLLKDGTVGLYEGDTVPEKGEVIEVTLQDENGNKIRVLGQFESIL